MARAVYLRVLDRVERLDYDVLPAATGLPPWERRAVRGSLGAATEPRRDQAGHPRRAAERTPIDAPEADVLSAAPASPDWRWRGSWPAAAPTC